MLIGSFSCICDSPSLRIWQPVVKVRLTSDFTSFLELTSCLESYASLPAGTHGLTQRRFSLANRITKTGLPYQNAIAHLERLELRRKIRESETDTAGDSVRAHLRQMYGVSILALEAGPSGGSAGSQV